MRAPRLSDERGIALAVAIFALVVIGALVAGTFFAGRLEQQSGQNVFYAAEAAEAADAGLSDAVGTALSADLEAIAIGDSINLAVVSLGAGVDVTRKINRLTEGVFLVRALGTRDDAGGNPLATRSVASLLRLATANLQINAGLTALGDVVLSGTAEVSGLDAVPAGWAAPPAVACPGLADKAGIKYNGDLTVSGAAELRGAPDSLEDPSLNLSNVLGDGTFEELKSLQTLALSNGFNAQPGPAVTANPTRCNTSVQSNWGDPLVKGSPCWNYFPIIYHQGDLSLSGGVGQGILLIEGNLTAQGGFVFYGPVIATGSVSTRGNNGGQGAKFYGGIVAQNVELDDSRLTGGATVLYSSCAIKRALKGSATVTTLNERSWAQLY
ncbi:MAG: hypothetical protein H0T90_02675 [Gemmatimonadales bacterium]|nr:hypothetical protein [Gemmatimonadales bacterium]